MACGRGQFSHPAYKLAIDAYQRYLMNEMIAKCQDFD
jgi:hypothetical protein